MFNFYSAISTWTFFFFFQSRLQFSCLQAKSFLLCFFPFFQDAKEINSRTFQHLYKYLCDFSIIDRHYEVQKSSQSNQEGIIIIYLFILLFKN